MDEALDHSAASGVMYKTEDIAENVLWHISERTRECESCKGSSVQGLGDKFNF